MIALNPSLATQLPVQHATEQPPAAKAEVTDAELDTMARDLHAEGARPVIKDDYDKRLAALANDFLPKLSTEDQGRFFKAIQANDKGAYDSWLQGGRLDNLVKDGRVTAEQRQQLLEGMADGYNRGNVESGKVWQFFSLNHADGGFKEEGSQRNPHFENTNTSAESFNRFMSGLNKADGTKSEVFSDFIQKYATDEINHGQPGDSGKSSGSRGQELSVLLNVADEAKPNQEMIASILNGVDSDKRAQLMDDVSTAFGNQTIINQAYTDMPAGYQDPMALLIGSVAHNPTTEDTEGQAADIANYVYEHSENNVYGANDYYDADNKPKIERQAALTDLMIEKGAEIFEDEYLGQSGIGEDGKTAVQTSVDVLANMERLTGLAPNNPRGDDVIAELGKNANDWRGQYASAGDKNSDDALIAKQRLTHIVASTEKSVRDGFSDKAEDDAAKQADIEKMMSVVFGLVSAVPGLGSISEGLSTGLKSVFGKNSSANDMIDDVIGKYGDQIDAGGGMVTDKIKAEITERLAKSPEQDRYLAQFKANANTFIEGKLLDGLPEGVKRDINIEAAQLIGTV